MILLAKVLHFQHSELWKMTADELDFWVENLHKNPTPMI